MERILAREYEQQMRWIVFAKQNLRRRFQFIMGLLPSKSKSNHQQASNPTSAAASGSATEPASDSYATEDITDPTGLSSAVSLQKRYSFVVIMPLSIWLFFSILIHELFMISLHARN